MATKATIVAAICVLACVDIASAGFWDHLLKPWRRHNCLDSKHAMTHFDLDRWSGHWYEAQIYNRRPDPVEQCRQNFFKPNGSGYNATLVFRDNTIDKKFFFPSVARKAFDNNEAKLNVTYGWPHTEAEKEKRHTGDAFWILDTDYENYAVTYSCNTFILFDTHYLWVYSRKPQLDQKFQTKIEQALVLNKLDPKKLKPIVQNCGNLFN